MSTKTKRSTGSRQETKMGCGYLRAPEDRRQSMPLGGLRHTLCLIYEPIISESDISVNIFFSFFVLSSHPASRSALLPSLSSTANICLKARVSSQPARPLGVEF